ncbi:MAG: hypothetical protein LLF94_03955 [Chlamydiales bacterium]|nr:hypothetical protein [Chlamydiales bacterium]
MYSEPERKIPLKKAIGYVVLSVCIIWGSLILTWLLHKALVQKRQVNPRYNIVALVQTCPQREALQNWQLAELLDISRDKPQNLYAFDTVKANKTLLQCPVIKKVNCRRLPPGIVHVDYQVREPKALLADFSNVALDADRYCFALKPYFTAKKLPEIYLGLNELSYSVPLETREAALAFNVLDYIHTQLPNCRIIRIDTHNAYINNAGLQELVVVLEEGTKTRYLRATSRDYKKSIDAYKQLISTFDTINPASLIQIIDLRSPSIALVK